MVDQGVLDSGQVWALIITSSLVKLILTSYDNNYFPLCTKLDTGSNFYYLVLMLSLEFWSGSGLEVDWKQTGSGHYSLHL